MSDNISVNPRVRIPSTLWDSEWDLVKVSPYLRQEDAAFVKGQILNPVVKRWKKAWLKKIEASPRKAIDSDEFVAMFETGGRVSFNFDLPVISSGGKSVVISTEWKVQS